MTHRSGVGRAVLQLRENIFTDQANQYECLI